MTKEEQEQAKKQALSCRELGGNMVDCALHAGVDKSTLYRWRDGDETFATALRLAKSKYKLQLVRAVQRRKPEFILERKFRREYGQHLVKEAPKDNKSLPFPSIEELLGR